MFSDIALKVYAAVRARLIKSRVDFWNNYSSQEKISSLDIDLFTYRKELEDKQISLICWFDKTFPLISPNIKISDRPFLFCYQGDISLLSEKDKNIAVIGVLTPNAAIEERERKLVTALCKNEINIISGLAYGCDSIAHNVCIENGRKTVAFIPSTLTNIYPAKNLTLVHKILKTGGLVVSEYVQEAESKGETIKRFVERDRLQALFSNCVVLVASYKKGEGDSGSRHAMAKAKEYGISRCVMYNITTDKGNPLFGLNEIMLEEGAKVITNKAIVEIVDKTPMFIVDLDETLVNTEKLNNDAYNYALEKYGYNRINTDKRITRKT